MDGQVSELTGLEADHAAREVQQMIDDEEDQMTPLQRIVRAA